MLRRCITRLSPSVDKVKHTLRPISFYENNSNLSKASAGTILSMGCTKLFPVQARVYEDIVAGKDVQIRSPTGTGKTMSYVLPLISRLLLLDPAEAGKPHALVLAPTPEICEELRHMMLTHSQQNLSIAMATRTRAIDEITETVAAEVDVIIGTPGMMYFLMKGIISIDNLKIIVLDEADMHLAQMSKSTSDHVAKIIDHLEPIAKKLQWVTVSAALSANSDRIQPSANPVVADMVDRDDSLTNELITHQTLPCEKRNKTPLAAVLCKKYLQKKPGEVIVIFADSKFETQVVASDPVWKKLNLEPVVMNSTLTVAERQKLMRLTKQGHRSVVIATDIMSRGLNIDNLNFVINLGAPTSTSSYIYRCGRTARNGVPGLCVTILSPGDEEAISAIQFDIRASFKEAKLTNSTKNLVKSLEETQPVIRNKNPLSSFDSRFSSFVDHGNRLRHTSSRST
eukprot:TRINITY_DN6446_c0_g1_i1.p1 TRINITY_DN6446_c0_g1~~TRINITY_DN6446_c0_g1_i1.p1  ORF type:complete len:455 (+),score=29.11 TRINITY_DN6446_c0_g1_i1:73-1437(+)